MVQSGRGHYGVMPAGQISAASSPGWTWDPTLYAGAARHYTTGRVAYPAGVVDVLVTALDLDGTGRLLDVGCGPGSLTLLLAPHFAEAIGVDADADMLGEAARLAEEARIGNVRWMQMHVGATTHQGVETDAALPHPRPPRHEIARLVRRYLGPVQRAGHGVLTPGTPEDEGTVYRAAGFTGPQRVEVPGWVVERTAEEIAASVYSLSSSTPHLFAERLSDFDTELRLLLGAASPDGRFSEQISPIGLYIWR